MAMAFAGSPFEADTVSITGAPFCEYASRFTLFSIVSKPFVPSAYIEIADFCFLFLFMINLPFPEIVKFPPYPSPQIKMALN